MVTLLTKRQQRCGDRRNTGRGSQPGFTSFQYRQLFLQRISGRVTQAGVNVPGLFERKAGGTLFGAVKTNVEVWKIGVLSAPVEGSGCCPA